MSMPSTKPEETELGVLKEILKWVKFSGAKEVRSILTSTLDDEQKRSVYQLSDGTKGIVEIGKLVGIRSTATIYKMWKQWAKMGLGESVPVMGGTRFKRSFDLEDFGLETNVQGSVEEVKVDQQLKPRTGLEEFQPPVGEGTHE